MTGVTGFSQRLAGALGVLLSLAAPAQLNAQPASAPAGSALYEVEMIVFRAASTGAAEDWSAEPAGRGFGNAAAGGTPPEVMRVLPSSEYRLAGLEASLRSSGAWRPIAHAAWIQSASTWGTPLGVALSDIGVDVPGLSGTVYLERAPIYVHLGFDVRLSAGATYAIKEMRSIRYNDKQYFDHPAFGIVAMVTPIRHTEGATTR